MKLTPFLFLLLAWTVSAEPPYVAPSAPPDKPLKAESEQARKLDKAIAPYVAKAKKTYPEAKKRFLAGLPPRYSFFITTRLWDKEGRYEQTFIAVESIVDGKVSGLIWSEIQLVKGYKTRERYTFPESEMMDWLITKPDGSEEGNFVGKFMDTYRP